MPAKPFKKGNCWWTTYKNKWIALGDDKATAFQRYGELEEKIAATKHHRSPKAETLLWETICKEYLEDSRNRKAKKSRDLDRTTIELFNKLCPITTLHEFQSRVVEEFRTKRKVTPIRRLGITKTSYPKDSTVNRELGILKALGQFVENRGYAAVNPLRAVKLKKLPKQLPRHLSDHEIEKLRLACADKFDALMLDLAYYTGMRLGEICNLRYNHIDFDQRLIRITQELGWTAKDYEEREVPIVQRLYEQLMQSNAHRVYVLSRNDHREREDYLQWRFEKMCSKAGVEATFHQLRHTRANRLARNNTNLNKIQRLLGHSDPKTTARYTMTSAESMRQDMEESL